MISYHFTHSSDFLTEFLYEFLYFRWNNNFENNILLYVILILVRPDEPSFESIEHGLIVKKFFCLFFLL